MLPPLDYLAWAQRHYGALHFDLASSGLAPISAAELGEVPAGDDVSVWKTYMDAIAARYGVTPAEVTPVLGASGGLYMVYAGMLDRGDEVLIETPAYEPVVRVAEGAGLSVRRFARRRQAAFALELDVVEAALSPATRAVVVTDLHNPTGVALDHAVLAELASRLERRGVLLFVDEVYAELAGPGRTARTLGPNVLVTSSLTKCFGVPWARAGFVLSSPELARRGALATLHLAGNLPASVAAYGARGFERMATLEARRHRLLEGRRALVDAWLLRHAATLSWVPPHPGSLFGFVYDARGGDLRPRLEAGVAELGVLAAAGSFFGEPAGFRLGWTCPTEKLGEALSLLARALGLPVNLFSARRGETPRTG